MKARRYLVLTLKFRYEDNIWTAVCEELGTATQAHSLPQVEKELKEAVELHLEGLDDVGELERFFERHKIKVYQNKPRSIRIPAPVSRGVTES